MNENPSECSIKVVCRFRPLNSAEEKAGSKFMAKFPAGSEDCVSVGEIKSEYPVSAVKSCSSLLCIRNDEFLTDRTVVKEQDKSQNLKVSQNTFEYGKENISTPVIPGFLHSAFKGGKESINHPKIPDVGVLQNTFKDGKENINLPEISYAAAAFQNEFKGGNENVNCPEVEKVSAIQKKLKCTKENIIPPEISNYFEKSTSAGTNFSFLPIRKKRGRSQRTSFPYETFTRIPPNVRTDCSPTPSSPENFSSPVFFDMDNDNAFLRDNSGDIMLSSTLPCQETPETLEIKSEYTASAVKSCRSLLCIRNDEFLTDRTVVKEQDKSQNLKVSQNTFEYGKVNISTPVIPGFLHNAFKGGKESINHPKIPDVGVLQNTFKNGKENINLPEIPNAAAAFQNEFKGGNEYINRPEVEKVSSIQKKLKGAKENIIPPEIPNYFEKSTSVGTNFSFLPIKKKRGRPLRFKRILFPYQTSTRIPPNLRTDYSPTPKSPENLPVFFEMDNDNVFLRDNSGDVMLSSTLPCQETLETLVLRQSYTSQL